MLDREKENFYKMHVYHVVVVKDKYGDIDLDNVADDSSDSSSSEDEEATVGFKLFTVFCCDSFMCILTSTSCWFS